MVAVQCSGCNGMLCSDGNAHLVAARHAPLLPIGVTILWFVGSQSANLRAKKQGWLHEKPDSHYCPECRKARENARTLVSQRAHDAYLAMIVEQDAGPAMELLSQLSGLSIRQSATPGMGEIVDRGGKVVEVVSVSSIADAVKEKAGELQEMADRVGRPKPQ